MQQIKIFFILAVALYSYLKIYKYRALNHQKVLQPSIEQQQFVQQIEESEINEEVFEKMDVQLAQKEEIKLFQQQCNIRHNSFQSKPLDCTFSFDSERVNNSYEKYYTCQKIIPEQSHIIYTKKHFQRSIFKPQKSSQFFIKDNYQKLRNIQHLLNQPSNLPLESLPYNGYVVYEIYTKSICEPLLIENFEVKKQNSEVSENQCEIIVKKPKRIRKIHRQQKQMKSKKNQKAKKLKQLKQKISNGQAYLMQYQSILKQKLSQIQMLKQLSQI